MMNYKKCSLLRNKNEISTLIIQPNKQANPIKVILVLPIAVYLGLSLITANAASCSTENDISSMSNGSSCTLSNNLIVSNINTNGSLIVSGNTQLTSSSNIIFANHSGVTADLTVNNGAKMSATSIINIGWVKNTQSTANIDGAGSYVTADGIIIGEEGSAVFNITNGARVVVTQNYPLFGFVGLGNKFDSTGILNMSGDQSSLYVTGDLYVNADGSGTVNIGNGAQITVNRYMLFGDSRASTGTGIFNLNTGGVLKVGGTNGITVKVDPTQVPYQFNLNGGTLQTYGSKLSTNATLTLVNGSTSTIDANQLGTALEGNIVGTGNLILTGKNTISYSGKNTYTGNTYITDSATLATLTSNTLSANASYHIDSNSTLDLNGYNQTVSSITNNGLINFNSGSTYTTLTTNGNYIGNNGTVLFKTNFTDDKYDLLAIKGNASGSTKITLSDTTDIEKNTSLNGIKLVQVDGASSNNAFLLSSTLNIGAFEYQLYQGTVDGQTNNWYLRRQQNADSNTISYRKATPMYSAIGLQLRQTDMLMLKKAISYATDEAQDRFWITSLADHSTIHQNNLLSATSKTHYNGLQTGSTFWHNPNWQAGAYLGYLQGRSNMSGFASGYDGETGETKSYSKYAGIYLNRHWEETYVNLTAQYGLHRFNITPLLDSSNTVKGKTTAVSLTAGHTFSIADSHLQIEPNAQIAYQWSNVDDTAISGATHIHQRNLNNWLFRIGTKIKGEYPLATGKLLPYAELNLYHSPGKTSQTIFSYNSMVTPIDSNNGFTTTELSLGMNYMISPNVKIYSQLGRSWSHGSQSQMSASLEGMLGFAVVW